MNENSFFFTIDKIDDELIAEALKTIDNENAVSPVFAQPVKKSRRPIFAIAGIAACFALVFAIGTAVKNNMGMEITQPPVNSAGTVTEETTTEPATEKSETSPEETEPEGVEITDENGVKFTLYGQPLESGKLSDFSYENYHNKRINFNSYITLKRFIETAQIPDKEEIIDLMCRSDTLNYLLYDGSSFFNYDTYDYDYDGMKPYIKTDEDDGYKFYETGIKTDSYYNALCQVFTEEAARLAFENEGFAPVSYNGELWRAFGDKGGNIGMVNSEYELVSATDTEIEINQINYYGEPTDEYYPWWKDLYGSRKLKYKIVKTDKGWRMEVATPYEGAPTGQESFDPTPYTADYQNGIYPINEALKAKLSSQTGLSPVREPWTEELLQQAWEILVWHCGLDTDSGKAYTGTYYADIDGDGVQELFMTGLGGNALCIFKLDETGKASLYKECKNSGSASYKQGYYLEKAPTSPSDIEEPDKIGEKFLNQQPLTIFTDKDGRYYIISKAWCYPAGPVYMIDEIRLDLSSSAEASVSPLYIWGRLGARDGEVYDGTVKYKKYELDAAGYPIRDEEKGTYKLQNSSLEETESFINSLKPAE